MPVCSSTEHSAGHQSRASQASHNPKLPLVGRVHPAEYNLPATHFPNPVRTSARPPTSYLPRSGDGSGSVMTVTPFKGGSPYKIYSPFKGRGIPRTPEVAGPRTPSFIRTPRICPSTAMSCTAMPSAVAVPHFTQRTDTVLDKLDDWSYQTHGFSVPNSWQDLSFDNPLEATPSESLGLHDPLGTDGFAYRVKQVAMHNNYGAPAHAVTTKEPSAPGDFGHSLVCTPHANQKPQGERDTDELGIGMSLMFPSRPIEKPKVEEQPVDPSVNGELAYTWSQVLVSNANAIPQEEAEAVDPSSPGKARDIWCELLVVPAANQMQDDAEGLPRTVERTSYARGGSGTSFAPPVQGARKRIDAARHHWDPNEEQKVCNGPDGDPDKCMTKPKALKSEHMTQHLRHAAAHVPNAYCQEDGKLYCSAREFDRTRVT